MLIIGVNLEGALGCTAALAALARSGGTIRLLAMAPEGTAELAPLLWLHAEADEPWFSRYLAQCEACFTTARTWDGASD